MTGTTAGRIPPAQTSICRTRAVCSDVDLIRGVDPVAATGGLPTRPTVAASASRRTAPIHGATLSTDRPVKGFGGRMMMAQLNLWIAKRGIDPGRKTRMHLDDKVPADKPIADLVAWDHRRAALPGECGESLGGPVPRFGMPTQCNDETVFCDIRGRP